jgi:hypothetical protein
MRADEQPHITKDTMQDHQEGAVAMHVPESSVGDVATAALPEARVAYARGTEAPASRAEAARAKGWPTLVN